MSGEVPNNQLIEAAIRGEIVIATSDGSKAANIALQTEIERARENFKGIGRSGDVDVIDLREDNAYMQATVQNSIHQVNIADLRVLANATVIEPNESEKSIVTFGSECNIAIEYDYGNGNIVEKVQHCKIGGPCETMFLKTTETGARWLSYGTPIGRVIINARPNEVSPSAPITFPAGKGIGKIIAITIL